MLSTIHLRTNQILSPGGEGSEDFFLGGGVKWFSGGTGGGGNQSSPTEYNGGTTDN